MAEFDPEKPGQLVHDRLSGEIIEWEPELHRPVWHQHGHHDRVDGIVELDGLLLDGWMERPQVKTQDGKHEIDDDFYDDFPEVKR
jgi:hypothetical protein